MPASMNLPGSVVASLVARAEGGTESGLSPDKQFAEAAIVAICCTIVAVSLAMYTWKKRWLFLPDTTISVLLGAVIGAAVTYGSNGRYESSVIVNSSFFFNVVLPPIMYEAGYAINRSEVGAQRWLHGLLTRRH